MDQVRVNLTLDKKIWEALDSSLPHRKKSKVINDLLKEIRNIKQKGEKKGLALAFEEASGHKSRLAVVAEWEILDSFTTAHYSPYYIQHGESLSLRGIHSIRNWRP